MAMRPFGDDDFGAPRAAGEPRRLDTADLTEPGAVAWGTALAEIIDTTTHQQVEYPVDGPNRRVKELLPPHESQWTLPLGPPNDLQAGGTLDAPRVSSVAVFPGIADTGWTPPDPTHAVGPDHIVTTVNMSLAFYAKDGTLEYSNDLGDAGSPGFFEPLGAGGFTFDPKCFYDHIAGRFVVLALEVYGSTESWITFAVSDDSNPNGTWYKYRTDAVISVSSTTYWWDYPGFGYDGDAYYVTGNLFGLNEGGWAGVGFRVIDKTDVLVGDPAVYATLRDGGAASVQVGQHFGSNLAPYFVSTNTSSSLLIHAITNPTTSPVLTSTTVSVPSFSDPFSAPAAGGYTVNLVDNRIMNVHWRDGNLYAAHNISSGGQNFARWYHMDTGNWPSSGSVSLVQSGNIDGGAGIHTWFPAIYSNAVGDVGLVCGSSSSTQRIAVNVTGRTSADPLGTMGSLTQVLLAPVDGGGRWGDYYDIAIDPTDDFTFWAIGEYPGSSGWANSISSFTISTLSTPVAVADDIGSILVGTSVTVDVMGNDFHTTGQPFDISAFDATSARGGTITLSVGTGPGGRDELTYLAPVVVISGPDSFNYTIQDGSGEESSAVVNANIADPNTIAVSIGTVPSSGTLPFSSQFWVQLNNLTSHNRRAALHIDVTIGNGSFYFNWRNGWMNLSPGEVFSTSWPQNFPAYGSLVGANVFELIGEDVTPSPYNQPPYAFSSDTDTDTATVTASN